MSVTFLLSRTVVAIRAYATAVVGAVLLSSIAFAQTVPLEVTGDNIRVVKVTKVVTVEEDQTVADAPFAVKVPPGGFGYVWTFPAGVTATRKGNVLQVDAVAKPGTVTVAVEYTVVDFDAKKFETRFGETKINVGVVSPNPVDPPKPIDPPKPQPVTSFRVILVTESAKTLTAAQNSVLHGKVVRDYLTANTTPEAGWAGWREFDKDANADKDSPTIKALWNAIKPKLTTTPCVAVEVNGNVEIIPLASTPAEMVATFDTYRKGGK